MDEDLQASPSIVRMRMTPTPSLRRKLAPIASPDQQQQQQQQQLQHNAPAHALQLVKYELLRVQRLIDSETGNTADGATSNVKAMEQQIMTRCASPSSSSSSTDNTLLAEMMLGLWKKIEELQKARGDTASANRQHLAGKRWPAPAPLFTSEGGVGESLQVSETLAALLSRDLSTMADEAAASASAARAAAESAARKKQADAADADTNSIPGDCLRLKATEVLLRCPHLRSETVRQLTTLCQLDASTEATLRRATHLSKQSSSSASASRSASVSLSSASAAEAAAAGLIDFDLDAILRRVCVVVETFAQEIVEGRRAVVSPARSSATRQQHQQQHLSPVAHRMLLPPVQSPTTATASASPTTTANARGEGKAAEALERERTQHAIETAELENIIAELEDRVQSLESDLDKAQKQLHTRGGATPASRAPASVDEESGNTSAAATAAAPAGDEKIDAALVAALREELAEARDTASALQKVRREEAKRSLDIIAGLEKQLSEHGSTVAGREAECERLENGVAALVEVVFEQQKEMTDLQLKTEVAKKLLHLHEQNFTNALFADACELREQLFNSQCQSDERERALSISQQRHKDVKEKLQVLLGDDATFIDRLKATDAWRTLTLAAADETADAVDCLVSMFEQRKAAARQQEDAQSRRMRMLESRLNEEVVTRRQRNVQNVPAPDAAEARQAAHDAQAAEVEEGVRKAYATAKALHASKQQQQQPSPQSPQSPRADGAAARVIRRSVEKRAVTAKDLKPLLFVS